MFVKRLFPNRWAKILVWTGAALAWSSVAVAAVVRSEAKVDEQIAATVDPVEPASTTTSTLAPLPEPPEEGLVVIRYTPGTGACSPGDHENSDSLWRRRIGLSTARSQPAEGKEQGIMIHSTFPAMGTTIEVIADSEDGMTASRNLFGELESSLSRFLPNSELSLINASREGPIDVSTTMAAILSVADDLRARTDGLVDPAVGAAVSAWGLRPFIPRGRGSRERP